MTSMSGGMTKNSKIMQYINYRMRVTVDDGRMLVGKFMAFDKHMNMVLCDCEEFRRLGVKGKANEEREEKRSLGLVLLRGEAVVSIQVESPPSSEEARRVAPAAAGPGAGRAAGRAMPNATMSAPAGLRGPAAGIGASGNTMAPNMGRGMMMPPPGMPGMPPMMMGRGMPGPPPGYGGPPPGAPPGMFPPGMGPPPGMFPPGMGPPGMRPPPGMFPPGMPPPPGMMPPPPGMPPMPPGMGRGNTPRPQ